MDAGDRGWLLFRLALLRRYIDKRGGIGALQQAECLAVQVGDPVLAAHSVLNRGLFRCWVGQLRRGLTELAAGVAALEALPEAAGPPPRAASALAPSPAGADPQAPLILWLALAGRYAEARALGERPTSAPVSRPAEVGILDSSSANAQRGLACVYAALGQPAEARVALTLAREAYSALAHHVMAGETAVSELDWVVLPYQADRLTERRRLVAEAEEAWGRARGVQADWPPDFARLPVLVIEGQWDEARRLAASVHDSGDALPLSRTLGGSALGLLAHTQGDQALAWKLVRERLPAGPDTAPGGTVFLIAQETQRLAAALALDAGDLMTAHAWLAAHDRWLSWSGAILGQADSELGWARYHCAAGDPALAHRHATRALARASAPRQPLALPAVHRLLGELETTAGRHADAAAHLDAALVLAEACAAPYERALTLLALAELRQGCGHWAEATALLDEARTICTLLGAAPALARADALAAALAGAATRPVKRPAGLTGREVEVLRLIAAGKSNREIAVALSISVRAVERHINNTYRKIDARGKADATAYAIRHNLV